jgi:hypothetical protein
MRSLHDELLLRLPFHEFVLECNRHALAASVQSRTGRLLTTEELAKLLGFLDRGLLAAHWPNMYYTIATASVKRVRLSLRKGTIVLVLLSRVASWGHQGPFGGRDLEFKRRCL